MVSLVPLTQPTNSTDSQAVKVANAQSGGIERCVITINPTSHRADEVVEVTPENSTFNCFDNLEDYVAFRTDGKVQLPANATQHQADALLRQHASLLGGYLLARFYEHPSYVGSFIEIIYTFNCGSYWIPNFSDYGSNWQNRISSIRTYSACSRVQIFNLPYYTGYSGWCYGDCASLGAFDDDVKSAIIN